MFMYKFIHKIKIKSSKTNKVSVSADTPYRNQFINIDIIICFFLTYIYKNATIYQHKQRIRNENSFNTIS